MHVGIVMVNWGIGGSEKRFANLFNHLTAHSTDTYTLIVNRFLKDKLDKVGIPLSGERLEVLLNDGAASFFERTAPTPGVRGRFKVAGPNWVFDRMFEIAHRHWLACAGKPVSKLGFDVVHYVFPYFSELLGDPRQAVLSCQDTGLRNSLLKNPFFLSRLRTDGFFDIASESIKRVIVQETGISDDRRLRVGPCTFIDYGKTRVDTKEPVVAFLGKLSRVKNPLIFVDAIQIARESYPGIRAVIMGDGPMRAEVQSRVIQNNLGDAVTVGFSPRPHDVLARALIFVSIQSIDNYHSQALMEAMACGCAVVASDIGETDRLVTADVGFRVQLNAEAIAEKVVWLLHHQETAEAMGLRARERVMSEHTIDRFVSYLEELYASAFQG